MGAIKISEDLRPLSDLKSRASDVVGQVNRTGRPVVLTRYGKGVAVVLSVDAYEELDLAHGRMRLFAALKEAERAVEAGDVCEDEDLDEMLEGLRAESA